MLLFLPQFWFLIAVTVQFYGLIEYPYFKPLLTGLEFNIIYSLAYILFLLLYSWKQVTKNSS